MNADVQHLTAALLDALGIKLPCGSVTLNINESELQSVKTETYARIGKVVDKRRDKA